MGKKLYTRVIGLVKAYVGGMKRKLCEKMNENKFHRGKTYRLQSGNGVEQQKDEYIKDGRKREQNGRIQKWMEEMKRKKINKNDGKQEKNKATARIHYVSVMYFVKMR